MTNLKQLENYITAFQVTNTIGKMHHNPTFRTFHARTIPTQSINSSIRCTFCNGRSNLFVTRITQPSSSSLSNSNGDDDGSFDTRRYDTNSSRQRKRDPIIDSINTDKNIALTILESSASFIFRRISLPSALSLLPGGQDKIEVPLVYILSVVISAAIISLTTWILLTAFFGIYLALGTVLMEEYDDLDNNFDQDNDGKEMDVNIQEEKHNGLIPLIAFLGALASAALLSPQGLSSKASFSLASPLAVIVLLLGGLVVLMGIKDVREDELKLEEGDIRESRLREEKRRMDLWDDEIRKQGSDEDGE